MIFFLNSYKFTSKGFADFSSNIMNITKLLTICSSLLLLQSNNILASNKTINNTFINDIAQENKQLMEYEYGDIWNNNEIQNATNNLALKLEYWGYNEILSKLNGVIANLFFNKNANKDTNEYTNKISKRYLNDIIRKNIVSKQSSLEDNIYNLLFNIHANSEDEIWKIILEDYSDKYIKSNQIKLNNDLHKIVNSSCPSEEIMSLSQQYKDNIMNKLKNAFAGINNENEYDYFENKFNHNKQNNEHIIYCYLLYNFTIPFQKYFIKLAEQNGFNKLMQNKYNSNRSFHYINKRLLPDAFEDNIIRNNISVCTMSSNDLNNKYKDVELNSRWKEYVNRRLLDTIDKDKSNSLINDLKRTNEYEYALLENKVYNDTLNGISIQDIINMHKTQYDTKLIKSIYSELLHTIWIMEVNILNYKPLNEILQNNKINNNLSYITKIYNYLINIRNEVLEDVINNIPFQNILNKHQEYFIQTFIVEMYNNLLRTMYSLTKDILNHKNLNTILNGTTDDNAFVITRIYDNLILLQNNLKKNIKKYKSQDVYNDKYNHDVIQLFLDDILNVPNNISILQNNIMEDIKFNTEILIGDLAEDILFNRSINTNKKETDIVKIKHYNEFRNSIINIVEQLQKLSNIEFSKNPESNILKLCNEAVLAIQDKQDNKKLFSSETLVLIEKHISNIHMDELYQDIFTNIRNSISNCNNLVKLQTESEINNK